jgi:hypothetical protein
MKAKAYHNVAAEDAGRHLGLIDGYQGGHPVTLVFTTDLPQAPDVGRMRAAVPSAQRR